MNSRPKTQPVFSKEEQAEMVLGGFWNENARKIGGNIGQRARALTITPAEIRAYVKKHGWPKSVVINTDMGSADGVYLVEKDGSYHLYSQERGSASEPRIFPTYDEAIMALAEDNIEDYQSMRK